MTQDEAFSLSLKHLYDTSMSMIQMWDSRDPDSPVNYGEAILLLFKIEQIVAFVKEEVVADASKLG